MPTNPFEPPKEVDQHNAPDWWTPLIVIAVLALVLYVSFPAIQRLNRWMDPPRNSGVKNP